MRNVLVSGFLAATLVLAGFVAAFVLFAPGESGANTTWQVEYFSSNVGRPPTRVLEFVESLPTECQVELGTAGESFVLVAYSCP